VTPSPEGGVDLRVASPGRGGVVLVAVVMALWWNALTLSALASHRAFPLATSRDAAFAIGAFLALAALWIAFAGEVWHLSTNCLEHRVGIGSWQTVRHFQDAELLTIARWTSWGKSYGRLYAVASGTQHFLMDRGLTELSAIAEFVSAKTGWSRRDAALR